MAGRLDVASYLTADQYAAQYRLIVDVLLDAQEQSLTGTGRDELWDQVRERIRITAGVETAARLTAPDVFDLDARMKALQRWGVVIRWQDKARTEADFIRTRDRYQLTTTAADLHRWLRRSIDEDTVATSAAAFAPAVIAQRLEEMLQNVLDGDHQEAAQSWAQVRTTLTDMADAAAVWQSRMASALAGAPDTEKVRQLRETILAYVTVWGAGIDGYSPRIRDAIDRLAAVTAEDWRAIALANSGTEVSEEAVAALIAGHRELAATLARWFRAGDGQALRLRRQVRDAVTPLLRGSRVLLATGGSVTRRAELLRVAAQIEAADTDAQAWRIWCAATGLWQARHLPGIPPEPPGSPANTSFWEAPPAPVEVTLRQRGARSARGRPASVPNRRAAREAARHAAAVDRDERARAEQELLRRSGRQLADWEPVELRAESALIWELLTALLRQRPDVEGIRQTYSRDGRWRVTASPAPPDRRTAVIVLPDGRLACENWRLTVDRT